MENAALQYLKALNSTGGRCLATDPDTDIQEVHCDDNVEIFSTRQPIDNPGYFAMISGETGFCLWVATRSHFLYQSSFYSNNPMEMTRIISRRSVCS